MVVRGCLATVKILKDGMVNRDVSAGVEHPVEIVDNV